MYDLAVCSRCKKTFIGEHFRDHVCTPRYSGSKQILIDYHTISKDELGRTRIMAIGMDGITYWLTVSDQEAIPIPFEPSTKRKFTGDETKQGFDSSHHNKLYILE